MKGPFVGNKETRLPNTKTIPFCLRTTQFKCIHCSPFMNATIKHNQIGLTISRLLEFYCVNAV